MIESAWKSLCAEHNFYLSSVLSIFSDKIFDAQKQRCFLKLKFMEALTILKWLKWLRWWQNKAQRLYKSNLSVATKNGTNVSASHTDLTAHRLSLRVSFHKRYIAQLKQYFKACAVAGGKKNCQCNSSLGRHGCKSCWSQISVFGPSFVHLMRYTMFAGLLFYCSVPSKLPYSLYSPIWRKIPLTTRHIRMIVALSTSWHQSASRKKHRMRRFASPFYHQVLWFRCRASGFVRRYLTITCNVQNCNA